MKRSMILSKIKSIKKRSSVEDRYDLSVESTGNFFANGILIHNSNGSIRIDKEGKVICQSRERIITPQDDNAGFARFISELPQSVFDKLTSPYSNFKEIVVYGEWAGKGIQSKVGICQAEKFWAIFAVKIINDAYPDGFWDDVEALFIEDLREFRIYNIADGKTWEIEVDFENPAEAINLMNQITLEVEKDSPFVTKLASEENKVVIKNGKLIFNNKSFITEEIEKYLFSIFQKISTGNETEIEIRFNLSKEISSHLQNCISG